MNIVAALLAASGGPARIKVNSPNLSAADSSLVPSGANASIVWNNNGDIERNTLFDSEWLVFGASSDYELFVATGTGDAPTGSGSLNTWQNMGSIDLGYALSLPGSSPNSKSWVSSYQIRLVSGGGIVGTGNISLNVIVDN